MKNIIFDLGNVILDIDANLSKRAFEKHGVKNFEKLYTLTAQSEIFDKLETGAITPGEFYDELRTFTKISLSDKTIETCWNALIVDFTYERIEILRQLKQKYRTFILSNTNLIHYNFYTNLLREKYQINGLEELVEKAYFSHEIRLKKPDLAIFHHVLNTSQLQADETLFIDDNKIYIDAAKKTGIETICLENQKLEDIFKKGKKNFI